MKKISLASGLQLIACGFLFAQNIQNNAVSNHGNRFEQLGNILPTPNEYRTASGAPGPKYWQQRCDYDIKCELDEKNLVGYIGTSRAITELQEVLSLPNPPIRIEGFDISNIQTTEPVASMVVFERGKPAKSDYRKFKIKTVEGQDDFAMMGEVVYRRYRRLKENHLKLPDLILIDGGKGQLGAAVKSLEELKLKKIPIISLAKQDEEVYVPGKSSPIRLPKDSPALHILQAVRDEAHRFAVSFHRLRRKKLAFT